MSRGAHLRTFGTLRVRGRRRGGFRLGTLPSSASPCGPVCTGLSAALHETRPLRVGIVILLALGGGCRWSLAVGHDVDVVGRLVRGTAHATDERQSAGFSSRDAALKKEVNGMMLFGGSSNNELSAARDRNYPRVASSARSSSRRGATNRRRAERATGETVALHKRTCNFLRPSLLVRVDPYGYSVWQVSVGSEV